MRSVELVGPTIRERNIIKLLLVRSISAILRYIASYKLISLLSAHVADTTVSTRLT